MRIGIFTEIGHIINHFNGVPLQYRKQKAFDSQTASKRCREITLSVFRKGMCRTQKRSVTFQIFRVQ